MKMYKFICKTYYDFVQLLLLIRPVVSCEVFRPTVVFSELVKFLSGKKSQSNSVFGIQKALSDFSQNLPAV